MDTSKYKTLYLQEAREHLSGIEQGLLTLDKNPRAEEAARVVDELFRHYHTVKGMSASMGYQAIQDLSHAQEDLLDKIRSGGLQVTGPIVSTLFECLDGLTDLVDRVEGDEALDLDIAPFAEKLEAAVAGGEGTAEETETAGTERGAEGKAPSTEGPAEPGGAAGAEAAPEPVPEPPTPPARSGDKVHELKISRVMKVESSVFDELLAGVGDLFMSLSSLKGISATLRSIELKEAVYNLAKNVNRLHTDVLEARMLPIADLTAGLPRVVRDISSETGKDVELATKGTNLRLDRAILENLGSPLVHIIRNAVDHGIEPPAEREKAGKPAKGQIGLSAHTRKDRVVIEVSDDGRGIDVERIRAKAVERGLPRDKVEAMTDAEAKMLVCSPGLSSAEKITGTSGRGVGMDVVKDTIEGLGGKLSIRSEPGHGAAMVLELPRTTSIVKALSVTVSDEEFLIPISGIERVVETDRSVIQRGTLDMDGTEVPVTPLAALLDLATLPSGGTVTVIVVETPGPEGASPPPAGLVVDSFNEEIDAYVKPLTPPISGLWGVSGITITGDGRAVFVLDAGVLASKTRPAT